MYEDKRHKADYISLQLAFMNDLTNLSLRLKDPRIGKEKNNYLFKELKRINDWVETSVRAEAPKVQLPETRAKFAGGIVFPMRIGDDRDPFVILGNIPELSAVFETKARAPFKIVFEVCRLSELVEETLAAESGAAINDQERPLKIESDEENNHSDDKMSEEEQAKPIEYLEKFDVDVTEADHMSLDNPFGLETDVREPDGGPEKFAEVSLDVDDAVAEA